MGDDRPPPNPLRRYFFISIGAMALVGLGMWAFLRQGSREAGAGSRDELVSQAYASLVDADTERILSLADSRALENCSLSCPARIGEERKLDAQNRDRIEKEIEALAGRSIAVVRIQPDPLPIALKAGTKFGECVYKRTVVGYTFQVELALADKAGSKQAYLGDVGAFECNGRWFLRGATAEIGAPLAPSTSSPVNVQRESLDDVVALLAAHKEPTLVGPFESINITPTLVSRNLDPALCAQTAIIPAWCQLRDSRSEALYRVRREPGDGSEATYPVTTLRITVPDGSGVRERLAQAWGQPTVVDQMTMWFSPNQRMRATLHKADMPQDPEGAIDIDFSGYLSLASLLDDERLFGFRSPKNIIGKHSERLDELFPVGVNDTEIALWPVESRLRRTNVEFGWLLDDKAHVIQGYLIDLLGLDHGLLQAAMTRQFGPPRKNEDGTLVFPGKPSVVLDGTTIRVGAPPGE